MTDHELLVSLQSQIAAQLGAPPVVTPPVVISPPVVVAPPAGVEILTFSTASRANKIQVTPGGLYAVRMPKIPAGGTFTTRDPATPPDMTVEMAYSRTPGEFESAKTDPANLYYQPYDPNHVFQPSTPRSSLGNAESNSLHWGLVLGQNTAKIDAVNEDWYMNLRVFTASGPLIYWYAVN